MSREETSIDADSADKGLGPREVIVEEHSDSEDSSPPSTSSEEEPRERPKIDIPPEYWHIQKLVKYMKTGNQTATVTALCCLKDHDLTNHTNQMAIMDIGGLEVLINLLETKNLKCKLGSLGVLAELSQNPDIRKCIADLGGISLLVKNLAHPARDLQILVAETIFNVAQIRKARKHVRKSNGIPKLVDLLDVKEAFLLTPWEELSSDEKELVSIAKAATRALWSVSMSRKNIQVMMKSGAVPLLARLFKYLLEMQAC